MVKSITGVKMGGGIDQIRAKVLEAQETVQELLQLVESETLPGSREGRGEPVDRSEWGEKVWEGVPAAVSPLAHMERIKILRALREGGKYFTELMNETGLSHSPLRFHLNVLIQGRYASQEYSRGRYLITRLGLEGLRHGAILASLREGQAQAEERETKNAGER